MKNMIVKLLSKKLSFMFLLVGMFFIHAGALAQSISVSGTITDVEDLPVPGVNILVKGTLTGTASDANGRYTISVPNSNAVLVFSSIGFASQEIAVGNRTNINVTLLEDASQLEEIVVVGYGVQRKVTVTGSVSTMRGEELKASPTTNLSNGIVGRMPGVIGFQRSDEPGGGGSTLRIRGTTTQGFKDPLYVIDGIPDREGGFDRLNPGDIESISVLKDASAAIYGSRAANGVVLITTKRGTEGKPMISYAGNWGFSQPTRLPEMCNAFEYATLVNEIDKYYKDAAGRYTDEDLRMYKDGSDPWGHPNTNYMKDAIKKVSPTYRHELGVSGGNDRVKYYTNISAVGQEGIFYNAANRNDIYGVRTNLDVKINDYISLSYGNGSRIEAIKYPTKGADAIFTALVRSKPTDVGFYPNGLPGPDLEYGDQPVVMATKATGLDDQKRYYIQNNLNFVIKVPGVDGLTVTPSFAFDKYMWTRKRFATPYTLYQWTKTDAHECIPITRGGGDGYVTDLTHEFEDRTSWTINTVVNYNFTVAANHNFGIMAGMEGQAKNNQWILAYRKNLLSTNPDVAQLDTGPLDERRSEGRGWKEARLNYFGRLTYNFQERYLFELIGRYDGSYRFPKNKRYGFFPGASAAWRISEENFWNVSAINFFKLRGSVSQTGNDYLVDGNGNLDRSIQYLSTYQFGTEYLLGTTFNKTLRPSRIPNPDITWERQTEYDLGIEMKFLRNRLSLESDIYLRKRANMLRYRNATLPQTSGITLPRENIGEMSNRGIELLIRWDERKGDVNYYAAFNMTYSKDKLDYIDEAPGIPDWQKETGKVNGTDLYYIADGVFQNEAEIERTPHWGGAKPGDLIFRKVDTREDANPMVINADDRVRINKRKEPMFIAGVLLGAEWKGFDVRAFIQGATGGNTYIYRERAGEAGNFFRYSYLNRWTGEGTNYEHPRIYNREEPYWASEGSRRNTYFLKSTDYIRLKTFEIGYRFGNVGFLNDLHIQNLRIFAQGSNLFTIDKIKIQDPEQNNASKDYMQRRYFNFGATLTF